MSRIHTKFLESTFEIWTPSGYTTQRIRDWRWLWLRHRTVKIPYWNPIKVTLHPSSHSDQT